MTPYFSYYSGTIGLTWDLEGFHNEWKNRIRTVHPNVYHDCYFAHFTLNTLWPSEICVHMALHHSNTSTRFQQPRVIQTDFKVAAIQAVYTEDIVLISHKLWRNVA